MRSPHLKAGNKEQIQADIGQTGEDQDNERPAGVPDRAQGGCPHVVYCIGDQPQGSNAKVPQGWLQDVGRRLHGRQDRSCERKADESTCDSQSRGNKERCPDGFPYGSRLFCTEILRCQNGSASCEPYVKHDKDSQHGSRGSADGGKGFFSGDPPHDQSIDCIVELLEKGTYEQREKEEEDLFPDDPLRDGIRCCGMIG